MGNRVHQTLLDSLGARIASGDPAPGSSFTLADLEQDYSASRTAAREAVKVLESIRMVESRRRLGIRVRPREDWDALDEHLMRWNLSGPFRQQQFEALLELRVAVEPLAARLAAIRATDAQRAELLRLATSLHELGSQGLGDSEPYLAIDVDYHRLLLLSSQNPQFTALTKPVEMVLSWRANLGLTPSIPVAGTLEDHLRTARSIVDGDADAAERHARSHVRTVWGEIAISRRPARDSPAAAAQPGTHGQ